MLRLTYEREQRGWSRQELSKRSGVTLPTLEMVEGGVFKPAGKVLMRLADALGYDRREAKCLLDRVDTIAAPLPARHQPATRSPKVAPGDGLVSI